MGVLEGVPAFRGYFEGVETTFLDIRNINEIRKVVKENNIDIIKNAVINVKEENNQIQQLTQQLEEAQKQLK